MDINDILDDDVRAEIRKRGYGIDHAHGMALAITEKTGEVRATDGLPRWKGLGGIKMGAYMRIKKAARDAKEVAAVVIGEITGQQPAGEWIRGARQSRAEASNMDRNEVSKIAAAAVVEALGQLGIDDETVETLRTLKQGKRRAPRKKAAAKKAPAKKGAKAAPRKEPAPEPDASDVPDAMTDEELREWGAGAEEE